MKRYQECNWITRQIRKLWYLTVPFVAMYYYITSKRVYRDEMVDGKFVHTDQYDVMSWRLCWSISIGDRQSKMKFYHTHDEVKAMMKEKYDISE